MTTKYKPKKFVLIVFIFLTSVAFLLAIGRWSSIFIDDFVVINSEIHSHISNLSLSILGYLGIGYSWLISGVKFRFIIILGAFMVLANFICESPFMAFMNTPDIIDALYGTVGILVVFIFLFITNKCGLVLKNTE